jgi:hypothetical protein
MEEAACPLLERPCLRALLLVGALGIFWWPHTELFPQACVVDEKIMMIFCCLHAARSRCSPIACPWLAACIRQQRARWVRVRARGSGTRRLLRLDELELLCERG